MSIRLLTSDDLPALMVLKGAAGWNQTEDDWLRLLRLQPDGCFGVEVEGQLAASTTVVCYGNDLAWIGMVLTLPEFRGRGLARQLMEHAIEFSGSRAIRLDASDMGRPLYLALDFVDECAIERWVRSGHPTPCSSVNTYLDLEADRQAFGADRSALLKELAAYEQAGFGTEAWAFARPGSDADYFGPCVSTTAAGFENLLRWFLHNHGGKRVFLDLFPDHREAPAIASRLGFEPMRRLSRMVRKPATVSLPDSRIYAIAGFEYG